MIKRINGSKALTKYISCKCKCKFDSSENGKYLESVIDDSVITLVENIDAVWSEATNLNFNDKKVTWKTDNFYILHTFLLITLLILTIVGIYYYYYHIKHR